MNEYAIMIQTRFTSTDEAIGLYSGCLCLKTGKTPSEPIPTGPGAEFISSISLGDSELSFTVDGLLPADLPTEFDIVGYSGINVPLNPNNGNPQTKWRRNIIAEDGLDLCEEAFDPTLGGNLTTMSMWGARLVQNPAGLGKTLWKRLGELGIDLIRCPVWLYAIIDEEFVPWREMCIEDVKPGEKLLEFEAVDPMIRESKDVLRVQVSGTGFPDAPDESVKKFLPLVIGRVPSAKLLPVTGQVTFEKLYAQGATLFESIEVTGPVGTPVNKAILEIRNTRGYVTNDPRLVGKYVKVVRSGTTPVEYSARSILSAAPLTAGGQSRIRITLNKPFDVDGTALTPPTYGTVTISGWWIIIYELSNYGVVSDGPVHSMIPPLQGVINGNLVDIEGRRIARLPSGNDFFPYAGVSALPEGEFAPLSPNDGFHVAVQAPYRGEGLTITTQIAHTINSTDPDDIVSVSDGGQPRAGQKNANPVESLAATNPYPAIGGDMGLVVSGVRDTDEYYSRAARIPIFGSTQLGISIIHAADVVLPLPQGLLLDDDEELAVAFDADFLGTFTGFPGEVGLRAWVSGYLLDNIGNPCSPQPAPMVLGGVSNNGSDSIKLSGNGGAQSYTGLRMCGDFYYDGYGDGATAKDLVEGTVKLSAVLRDKNAMKSVKAIKVRLIYQFTCLSNGYIPATTPIFQCSHKLYQVALFRKKDSYEGAKFNAVTGVKFGGTWGGRRTATEPITNPADAIEYLVRERDGQPGRIDTDSFDRVRAARTSYPIGKQVVEQAKSRAVIDEICKAGFIAVVPSRDGKLRVEVLDNYNDPTGTFDESTILKGSFADSQIKGLDRAYTGLELAYDQHPDTGDYRSLIFVRRTSEAAFPLENETEGGVPKWTLFAGGFSSYLNGKLCWEDFRAEYVRVQRDTVLGLEVSWFQKNTRIQTMVATTLPAADPAEGMAIILAEWFAGPRVIDRFLIPLTKANTEKIQLAKRIIYRDKIVTGNLYYYGIVEGADLSPKDSLIRVTVSRRLKDEGFELPPEAEYITEVIGGDTLTEVIGGDTLTEVII